MKNVLLILITLCTVFYSCDSLDLDDVGYGDGDRLKPSAVKAVIYAAPDGCWTTEYAGYKFFFQFNEDGTLLMDSEQMKDPTESVISFMSRGRDTELTIEGGGHFAYLGSELSESKFVISEVSESKIVCKGVNTNTEIVLLPSTKTAMNANAAQKTEFLDKIREYAVLTPSVISLDNNQFVAYYTTYVDYLNFDIGIKVITIEKTEDSDMYGHTKVYTSVLNKDGDVFKLETPVPEFKTMTTGDKCTIESLKYQNGTVSVNGQNASRLTVSSNEDAVATFDDPAIKWSCAKESVHGTKGAACQEIWDETNSTIDGVTGANLVSVEIFANYGDDNMKISRPLVFWVTNSRGYSTLAFPGSSPGANITKNEERDLIGFTKISSSGIVGWGGFTQEEITAVNLKLTNLLNFWFEAEGLYVTQLQGYIYLLSPTSGMWMKLQKS